MVKLNPWTKRISEPVKRHFDKIYPFTEPIAVEMMVAGTTMATEFKKKNSIPSQVPPTQNLANAVVDGDHDKVPALPFRDVR